MVKLIHRNRLFNILSILFLVGVSAISSQAQNISEPVSRANAIKFEANEEDLKSQPSRTPMPEGMVLPETPSPEPMPKIEDLVPAEFRSHPEFGGTLKGVAGSVELIHKRDRYSKEYQTSAHSYSKLQGYSAMHYKDDLGRWLTLDTSITVNQEQSTISIEKTDLPLVWNWQNDETRSDFEPGKQLVFKNTTLHFANEEHEYTESIVPSNSNLEINTDKNTAFITDYWPSVDKWVTINNWGFKHEYVLNERLPQAENSAFLVIEDFVEIPQGWTLINTGSSDFSGEIPESAMMGDILVENDNGDFKGLINVPSIYETVATKENSDKEVHFTAYEVEKISPTEYKLVLVVPTDYLNDSNTVYPVVIDPSASQSYLSTIGTNYPNATSACQSSTMNVNVGSPAKNVTNTYTDFRMRAQNGSWISEQRANIIGPAGTTYFTGPGNNSGGLQFYANNSGIANGVRTGNIPFNWRGWRTWGYSYTYTYSCGWNGWSTCTGTSTEYCGTRWQYMQPNWYVRVDYCDIPQGGTMTPSSTSVCEGTSVNIQNYGWSAGNVAYWASTQGGYPCSWDIYNNAYTANSNFNYTYPANGNTSGCEPNPWRVRVACYSYNSCYGWNWGTGHTIYINVYEAPTAPTSISGTNEICPGASTTLTLSGGGNGAGATYQWFAGGCGSGGVLGTGSSINVSPASTTTYYARRVGNTGCTSATGCASITVYVGPTNPNPTNITGTNSICEGESTTLTMNGGHNALYEFNGNYNDSGPLGLHLGGGGGTIIGNAWEMQGNDRFSPSTNILNTDKYTIEFDMMYTGNPSGWQRMFSYQTGSGDRSPGLWKYPGGNQKLHWRHNPGNTGINESFFYNLNQWYHVVGEKDGGTLRIFVDGVLVASGAVANPKTVNDATMRFGAGSGVRVDNWEIHSGVIRWYANGSCSGSVVGYGPTLNVTPTSTTTYSARIEGECNTTSCVTRTVTVNTVPVAFAGLNQAQCSTTAYQINDASITGSGTLNNWTYVVNSGTATVTGTGTMTPTITPTSAGGQVTMTMNVDGNGSCPDATDVMVMDWSAGVTANAGPAFNQCGNANMPFSSSSASSPSTFSWALLGGGSGTGNVVAFQNGGAAPTDWRFEPTSASGSRTLRLTVNGVGSCGGTDTDDFVVTWDETPTVSTSSPINSCTGLADIVVSGASSSGTYSGLSWSLTQNAGLGSITAGGTTLTPTFTPQLAPAPEPPEPVGQYILTLQATGSGECVGTNPTSDITLNFGEAPTANAGSDVTECEGTAVTLTGSSVTDGAFSSVNWTIVGGTATGGSFTASDPSDPTGWTITATSAGYLDLQLEATGSGAACLSATSTGVMRVTWEGFPTVNAGTDILNSCTGSSVLTLTGATAGGTYSAVAWTVYSGTGGTITNGGLDPAAWTVTPTVPASYLVLELTVTGSGSCAGNDPSDFRVVEWGTDPIINSVTATDVTDCSNDNGVIVVDATGYGPLSYSNDGGTTSQGASSFDFLNDGVNYDIVVTDTNNCSATYASNPVVLDGPTTPVLNITTADALCNGAEDGQIQITVTSGGTPWYAMEVVTAIKTYLDTANALNETITLNVVAGTYNIDVADRFGCTTSAGPYTINEPAAISVSTTVINNTNCTGTDGSITVNAAGGTPGFTYSFNGGGFSGTNVLTGLGTGDYPIIVRDNNNCEIPFLESIGGPFIADAGIDRYLCSGSAFQMNGQLDVTAVTSAGGASNYTSTAIAHSPRTPSSWTPVGLGDDQVSGAIGIPFTFTFYGTNYSNVYISSNGFVTFNGGSGNGCCSGQSIPNAGAPNNLIALCWEDLNPNYGGTIQYGTYGTAPNRVLVIEYNNIQHYGGGNAVTGQILLFESTNNIELHNTSVLTDGGTNTMGIENATGNLGVATHASGGWNEISTAYMYQPPYDLGTINYTWSPSAGLSSTSIVNPTVSGITADQVYTLEIEIVGICTITDDMTVYVSDLSSESSGTYGTAPNVTSPSDVVCNGDDDGCITVTPTTGVGPYLLEGPGGVIQAYGGRMKQVAVANPSGLALTDYQVALTVSYESAMRADFGDIRFFDGTTGNIGDVLPYYVESYTLSSTATVYVKLPNIPSGGTSLYMLYGDNTLTSQSDPDNTLLLYEDMMATPSGTFYGNSSYIDHQFARLTQAINSTNGQLDYNLNPSTGGNGYVADFEFWIGGGNGADALYHYSDCASRPFNEDQATGGYTFVYDTYNAGGQHQIKYNGVTLGTNAEPNFDNSTWRDTKIEQVNTTGNIYLDGTLRLTSAVTADNAGNAFGFGARTGGLNNEHRVRNIRVRKLVSPAPTAAFGVEELPDNQFCGLSPGNYTISVWDVAECTITEITIPIAEPTLLTIDNIDVSDTWCYISNVGELDITVSGGTPITPAPDYLYTWAGPSSYSSNLEDPTGLSPGIYNVTVVDDNACSASSSATVNTAVPINAGHYTWEGTTNNLWQISTNWDCGLPDVSSEVIIPASPSGGIFPLIQNGIIGDVLNIEIQGGTSDLLQIEPGGLLRVNQ